MRETVKKMDSGSEKGGVLAMEERERSAGFNKKRAEGRDESDRPKKLQLKVRTLNPANTIAYVQVKPNNLFVCFDFFCFFICCLDEMLIVLFRLILLFMDLMFFLVFCNQFIGVNKKDSTCFLCFNDD